MLTQGLGMTVQVRNIAEMCFGMCECVQDLEDVRCMMQALEEVRQAEIEMDMELAPIEECYVFLQRCGVSVAREEMERVDNTPSRSCSVYVGISDLQ